MQEYPLISVIVPVYNVEKYLPRCIDSILSQSFTDFELLLIDDGSPDNCGKICDEYAAKNSRVKVFHKPNGGVSSARNLGLDKAWGEWIWFVDPDDFLYEDALHILSSKILGEYDCIMGGYDVIRDGNLITSNTLDNEYIWNFKTALLDFYHPIYDTPCEFNGFLWNRLLRHSVIKKGHLRFHEDIYYKEDGLFLVEFLCISKREVFVTTKPVYKYYINPEGAVNSLQKNYNSRYLTNLDARIHCWEMVSNIAYWYDFRLKFLSKYCIVQFYIIVKRYIKKFNISDTSILQTLDEKLNLYISIPSLYICYYYWELLKNKIDVESNKLRQVFRRLLFYYDKKVY